MSMKTETAAELKSYLERVERLEEERKEMADEIRAVYAEAKARGFEPKAIREMVKRRRKDPAELAEDDTLLETYMHACGMISENPLAAAVASLARDAVGRDLVIEALQKLVPMHGEIIAKVGGAPMRLWRGEDGVAYAAEHVEPSAAPSEKPGKRLKASATVLSIVPADPVKAAADRAERRGKPPVDAEADADEPVE